MNGEDLKNTLSEYSMYMQSSFFFGMSEGVNEISITNPELDLAAEDLTKNITLRDVKTRMEHLPEHDVDAWLEELNNHLAERWVVPLGLKTTDGREQYLSYKQGRFFAARRSADLKQRFETLTDIPEPYRLFAVKRKGLEKC